MLFRQNSAVFFRHKLASVISARISFYYLSKDRLVLFRRKLTCSSRQNSALFVPAKFWPWFFGRIQLLFSRQDLAVAILARFTSYYFSINGSEPSTKLKSYYFGKIDCFLFGKKEFSGYFFGKVQLFLVWQNSSSNMLTELIFIISAKLCYLGVIQLSFFEQILTLIISATFTGHYFGKIKLSIFRQD